MFFLSGYKIPCLNYLLIYFKFPIIQYTESHLTANFGLVPAAKSRSGLEAALLVLNKSDKIFYNKLLKDKKQFPCTFYTTEAILLSHANTAREEGDLLRLIAPARLSNK